jgi:hypothetical protein
MSVVLRKKIEAGVGMPPAISQFDDFWEPLQANVTSWLSGTYAIETRAVPESRRLVQGDVARAHLEKFSYFVFSSTFSPGICAIGIDEVGVTMNARHRLQQPSGDLEGVSELFMRLLIETPVVDLWRLLSSGLSDHRLSAAKAPTTDFSVANGGFGSAQRYLIVEFAVPKDGQACRICLIFHFDYVERNAEEFAQMAAFREQASPGKGHGGDALRKSVKSSMIKLEGVLERLTLSIGECSRFEVGQIIALTDVDTRNVSLEAETVNGSVDIGHCEMGVWKRQRALKLKTSILEPFTRELVKL